MSHNCTEITTSDNSDLYTHLTTCSLLRFFLGCGFYPEDFFDPHYTKSDAIQVRLVGPNLGIAKGMLLKKRGITKIQLPSSMIKAPESQTCHDNWVAVVVKTVFPSKENNSLGRLLDPNAQEPCKSWREEDKRPLSTMYQRMLIGFGVTSRDVNTYVKRSKNCMKLCHGR